MADATLLLVELLALPVLMPVLMLELVVVLLLLLEDWEPLLLELPED